MGKGLVGGRIVSGYLQGKKAAEITLELISKPNANALTVIADTPTKYMFDYRYLEEHVISISALPEHSEVIYEPESAYERYKHWLIGLSAFSMAAALFVLWKYRTQQLLLKSRLEHNRKLELTVYERTMELEITNKKLKQLSNLDGLTQLFNRRFFDESIDTEIKRSQRASTPLSLLMCDIDLFKKFNDTQGHLAGDDCIKLVAGSIQQSCNRVTDVVARYGGEEFAAILPNTDSAGAEAIAKSIQSGLAEKNISFEHSEVDSKVTISIGLVTVLPEIDTCPNDVIAMADKALYTSKHKGRNRITVYLPDQP
ncbi:MAG: diguanylate cyclase domain-containing protein [Neptuniibacter sp.]